MPRYTGGVYSVNTGTRHSDKFRTVSIPEIVTLVVLIISNTGTQDSGMF